MSRDPGQGRPSSPWSNQNHGQQYYIQQRQQQQAYEGIASSSGSPLAVATDIPSHYYGHSAPPTTESSSKLPERSDMPTRSSTAPSADSAGNLAPAHQYPIISSSRSDDLNHGSGFTSNISSSPRPLPQFLGSASSRPSTPGTSATIATKEPSSSGHSDYSHNHTSVTSHSETSSNSKAPSASGLSSSSCSACGKAMQGPFVRALGSVFHLNCFKCMDCGEVVASKFFPIDGPSGKQNPLCERDYFRRLNLICAKCGMALRGSYITACNKKFHVEHFTCSLCSTLFGPQDSYYEHDGDVYCHFHYSTRFATKCAGCSSAILKQFVEINRNMRDECWHPECYMINKFWNVKVSSRRPTSSVEMEGIQEMPVYVEEESRENPTSLREKQVRMEQQVYRIWTVLSAFEESSAACISDMLRQVSNGAYLDAIRMAEKFILHVEVLFGAIDDLEFHFATLNMKGMSHVREARMLCRKTVELFTLLSHTQETGARRMGMTQELLALVTGLAHYLKILIRIALTGALKLEREQSIRDAMSSFLDKLHLLAVQGANPSAKRLIKGSHGEPLNINLHGNQGTQGVTYGFRSLAPENAGDSPFSQMIENGSNKAPSSPPSDLCVRCGVTVEEDCVRLGTYQRWHSNCIQCAQCGKVAAVPVPEQPQYGGQSGPTSLSGSRSANGSASRSGDERETGPEGGSGSQRPKVTSARRPPANVNFFVFDAGSMKETASFGDVPTVTLCTEHAHQGCRSGFQPVQRLEQYAFLLNVALRRLYLLLKQQGVVPLSPASVSDPSLDPYRNSDMGRMKSSVHLDRKLSATARLPKRSTIIESPAGRTVHPTDVRPQQQYQQYDAQYYQNNGGQMQQTPVGVYQQHQVQQAQQPQQLAYTPTPPQPPFQNSSSPPSQHTTPRALASRLPPETQGIKPSLQRRNTEVMVVDDSLPNSPSGALEESGIPTRADDVLTLADIPQWVEVAQAREQQRSLPRESSTPYIAELNALELAIVKHCAVLMLTRSPLKDQFDLDEILEMVEMKKAGFWGKFFKGDNKKNVKKKGVFGIPLELLVEREGSDSLLGATGATLRVPSFIDDVISAMRQMDISVEGIFRKNGNIRRLRELTEAIDRDPASVDLTQDNPVQLAALLKKFLRDLPDPLMTYKLHRLFIASQSLSSEEDRKRYLHLVSLLLPKAHRDTMEILFVFLKWVASFAHKDAETGSKMDLGNLATVICPSILYARGKDAVRDETFSGLRVITSLLENQDEFFTVPEDFVGLLHDQEYFNNCMELPSKEFMKKCDAYMRVKSGRQAPGTPYTGAQNNGQHRHPANVVASSNGAPPLGPSYAQPVSQTPRIPQNEPYPQPSSPNMSSGTPQGIMQTMQQRPPQMEEWGSPQAQPPSRPSTSNGPTPSRPASYVGPRAAPQPPSSNQGHGTNGYQGPQR